MTKQASLNSLIRGRRMDAVREMYQTPGNKSFYEVMEKSARIADQQRANVFTRYKKDEKELVLSLAGKRIDTLITQLKTTAGAERQNAYYELVRWSEEAWIGSDSRSKADMATFELTSSAIQHMKIKTFEEKDFNDLVLALSTRANKTTWQIARGTTQLRIRQLSQNIDLRSLIELRRWVDEAPALHLQLLAINALCCAPYRPALQQVALGFVQSLIIGVRNKHNQYSYPNAKGGLQYILETEADLGMKRHYKECTVKEFIQKQLGDPRFFDLMITDPPFASKN
ncbi:Uncharacterised protein [Candidatus Gugararchaeum adminiculabundum]|nr:Uncharacterised protein [Candidatus Gugararchaeum adminiculabundum]